MSMSEFESVLKDVVNAKRLSASKMSNLTDIAMKNMENDTKLVSILYRTHKTLPTTAAKISSLYVFDALSRAAKHHATKNSLSGDAFTNPGNSASFLFKVGGVVEGLFQDLVVAGNPESKEKAKKILDIWVKGNTFPPTILAPLADILKDKKVPDTLVPVASVTESSHATPTVDPRTTQSTFTPPVSVPPTPSFPAIDQHAALLALLTQAAASTSNVPTHQTSINTTVSSHAPLLDAAQLAVIQQLAHTAASVPSVPQFLPPADLVNVQKFPSSGVNGSSHSLPFYRNEPGKMVNSEQRHSGYRSPEREPRPESHFDERDNMRGRYRAGFRSRGRGDRLGRAWDPRERDHYRSNRDQSPSRTGRGGRSRSRSPGPSSRYNGRRESRYASPPQTSASDNKLGKDEFGRDIRPESPKSSPAIDNRSPSPSHPMKSPPHLTQPSDPQSPLTATTNHDTEHDTNSVPSVFVNANTSPAKPSNTPVVMNGMECFNPATFDFTSPTDWEALGKMWQITNGYLPSTEELMQFVMTSAMGKTVPNPSTSDQNPVKSISGGRGYPRGRGRGRGGFAGGHRGAYGNGRNPHSEGNSFSGYDGHNQYDTDAIVLGETYTDNGKFATTNEEEAWNQDADHEGKASNGGGRMQKVGGKWKFVRGTAMDVS